MEQGTYLSPAEAVEYGEFKRARREAEVAVTLQKLVADASRRETDKHVLRSVCDGALKLHCYGVLVSPVNVAEAKKRLGGRAVVAVLAGGTGETLPAVKKYEVKRAIRAGAGEVRLVLCYSALALGNAAYLKREVRKVRRAAGKKPLIVSLEDHSLGEREVALGVRAAAEGGADAVCVRGETELLACAVKCGADRVRVDVSGVENAEQLRLLLKAGARRATAERPEKLAEEMYRAAAEEAALFTEPLAEESVEKPRLSPEKSGTVL